MRFSSVTPFLLLSVLSAVSLFASAGELLLTNGDRLQGTLGGIDKSSIAWSSDSFGMLTIAKTKVADLKTDAPVVIQGQRDLCTLNGIENHYLAYRCGQSDYVQRTELLTIASVQPYVEKSDKNYDYSGKLSVSGVFSRGNSVQDDLEASASSIMRYGDFRHVTSIDIDTLSTNDGPTTEDYELSYRLDWFFDEQWFWYNQFVLASEESKNIDEKYEYGTGLGVQMWENLNSALALESGIDFIKESYDDASGDTLERAAWRFATEFRYKLPFSAELVNSNEVLASLKDAGDWEFSTDLGISMPLGAGLFSEYKIEYDYDNQPADGTKRDDTKLTIGVGYKW